MPHWQKAASRLVHVGLLAAIVAMPVSGILMTIAGGRALPILGRTLFPSLGEIAWADVMARPFTRRRHQSCSSFSRFMSVAR